MRAVGGASARALRHGPHLALTARRALVDAVEVPEPGVARALGLVVAAPLSRALHGVVVRVPHETGAPQPAVGAVVPELARADPITCHARGHRVRRGSERPVCAAQNPAVFLGGLAQGLGVRLFAFGGAYWPLATAHADPLWARTCFGCVNGAPV